MEKQTIMCMPIQNLNAGPAWKLLKEILHNSSLGFVTRSTINNRASEEALKTWGMIRPADVGYKITPAGRELLKLKKKSGG
ncbi:MAG TPA: hypothetical protein VIJ01_15405 [Candidatus Angelobacter sp.]